MASGNLGKFYVDGEWVSSSAGAVRIDYPGWDLLAPFGGHKQSGNGREYADCGMRDYLETKGLIGHS